MAGVAARQRHWQVAVMTELRAKLLLTPSGKIKKGPASNCLRFSEIWVLAALFKIRKLSFWEAK